MRIRTVKPEFWMSERMCSLGAETRLLAIGLLNYADDAGYFLAHPALIRGALMPFAEGTGSIQRMLDELVEIEYLRIGEDEAKRKIGLVVNFKKHQRVDRPQKSKLEGLVSFPNWSPMIPGIVGDDSAKDQGGIDEDSTNVRGGLAVGMEGNGMEKEGIREGSGKPSPDKPGGDLAVLPLAGSSMPAPEVPKGNAETVGDEAADGHGGSNSVIPDPAESAKKKEGGGAAVGGMTNDEAGMSNGQSPESKKPEPTQTRRSKPKKEEGPEFPLDLPGEYREPLTVWWHHKRELRQGYTKTGWLMLVRQQQKFPAALVSASVEQSMTKPWTGLFTEKLGEERSSLGRDFGAKKGRGAGPVVSDREPVMVVVDEEPEGWREVWPEVYPFAAPERWSLVPESNRRDVLAALKKRGKPGPTASRRSQPGGGFECPVPCDWRVVWAEVYGELKCPETWEGVADVARRQIVARIEEKKGGVKP